MLGCAVEAVLKSMPRDERKPQFFLAQNLDAEVESIQEHGKAVWRATVDEPPRRAPEYLKEPSRGPLTGRVLEEHEKEMAPLRQKLGASEWKYPELPRSDR